MTKQTSRCPACKRLPEQGCIPSCTKKAANEKPDTRVFSGDQPHIKLRWERGADGRERSMLVACIGMTRKEAVDLAWSWVVAEEARTPIAERETP